MNSILISPDTLVLIKKNNNIKFIQAQEITDSDQIVIFTQDNGVKHMNIIEKAEVFSHNISGYYIMDRVSGSIVNLFGEYDIYGTLEYAFVNEELSFSLKKADEFQFIKEKFVIPFIRLIEAKVDIPDECFIVLNGFVLGLKGGDYVLAY